MFVESPRFPENIDFASVGSAEYEVFIAKLYGGHSVSDLINDEPLHMYDVGYGVRKKENLYTLLKFWHAMQGRFHWYRFKDWDDHKSCDLEDTPTAFDQVVGTGDGTTLEYQLIKTYTMGARSTVRWIEKPVLSPAVISATYTESSLVIGVGGVAIPASRYSLNSVTAAEAALGHTTMGRLVFSANVSKTITAITQAASALVTANSHGLTVGDSVHFSGVVGMTQINGLRATVLTVPNGNQFTVDISSLGFSAYASGGTINTNPQTGESITWGGEFDVPCRFETKAIPTSWHSWKAGSQDCNVEEVRLILE